MGQMEKSIPVTRHESVFTTRSPKGTLGAESQGLVSLVKSRWTGLGDDASQSVPTHRQRQLRKYAVSTRVTRTQKGPSGPSLGPTARHETRGELRRSNAR